MVEYAVSDLVKEVKVLLDRNQESAGLLAPSDSDTLSQAELIESKIVDAARIILSDAPEVEGTSCKNAVTWTDSNGYYVGKMVLPTSSPSIFFLIDSSTAYQELFHGSGIQFRLSVQLSVTLQHHAHGLTISFFILISSIACWFLALRAVHTQHILHQPTDKVVLQWFTTLLTDIVFLPDTLSKATLAFELNGIAPLVSIAVSLVSQSSLSEVIHIVIVSLSLQQDREGTLVRLVKSVLGCLHAIQFFLVKHPTQR